MEAVLPIELEVPSLRVMIELEINEAEWRNARFEELMLLDERRPKALYHVQGYQRRIARAFNKKQPFYVSPCEQNSGIVVFWNGHSFPPSVLISSNHCMIEVWYDEAFRIGRWNYLTNTELAENAVGNVKVQPVRPTITIH
ncbi:hypothetical protein Vadar_002522 [Vaccinium darrowii]|uniref:Uncharacterized protein n=1 Tax=Vaccinium darrowii TaxID=229202 RepID=A0ACB7Z139_9ERIC|nr:hypothetical protein Vadar_002522 [Vaccinium darrowii]